MRVSLNIEKQWIPFLDGRKNKCFRKCQNVFLIFLIISSSNEIHSTAREINNVSRVSIHTFKKMLEMII